MRYKDLSCEQQSRVDLLISDGAADLVHEARQHLQDDWDLKRREAYMAEQAKEIWEAIAADVTQLLEDAEKIQADDDLVRDLEEMHERLFVLAADPHWAFA